MSEVLCSVGIDVGTTTTQMVVSALEVENKASGFAVPELTITRRTLRYLGQVHLTPLKADGLIDGDAIGALIREEYRKADLTPEQVDTGAVIVTGETSRKENARAVLQGIARLAGDFVVTTAGPHLESVLAAKGSGAVAYSQTTGKRVLHIDIGGGTSNLALIEEGRIIETGCMNIGGRLIKVDGNGRICYLSPVLEGLFPLGIGQLLTLETAQQVAARLVQGLEMAAGLRQKDGLWDALVTKEAPDTHPVAPGAVLSFSGGVADCIQTGCPPFAYGDLGPVLGQQIRHSRLCQAEYILGQQTIRATVIGAGCHSALLSGSTVFYQDVTLPLKNLPVAVAEGNEQLDGQLLCRRLRRWEEEAVVLALPGVQKPTYEEVGQLAQVIARVMKDRPVYVCVEADMAKALGQRLCLLLPPGTPCLCIDRIALSEGCFLDVGKPVGPALPVVVKTLILSQ